jgi:hypothetical protein
MPEAIGASCEKPIIGIRSGEKIHEEMITSSDNCTTIQMDNYCAILPVIVGCKTSTKRSASIAAPYLMDSHIAAVRTLNFSASKRGSANPRARRHSRLDMMNGEQESVKVMHIRFALFVCNIRL